MITLPPGASLERTDSVVWEVVRVAEEIPDVAHVLNITGVNFMSGQGSSYATVMIKMVPWEERDITTNEVATILTEKTASIRNATFLFMGMPTLQGFGMSSGVELQLEDRTGGEVDAFFRVTEEFLAALQGREEVMMAMTTFNPNFPQRLMEADLPKIKEAGLTLGAVMSVLQAYIGSIYISNFNLYGKQFRVMVQAAPEYRTRLEDLNGIFVRTAGGEMAPVTEFLTITDVTGPQSLDHFNMYASMAVTVIPNYAKGYNTGDVINLINQEGGTLLPQGYDYEYSGMSREEAGGGNQIVLIFVLCFVFVYLLLSALYESYILPFAVLLSLPVGLSGVFIFIFLGLLAGSAVTNNIYVQIAMIMLIGLLAKNAILIVEYAIQRRKQGMSITASAVAGAVARLRPILMTSFAFIFGLIPLALASGAGAVGNRSIGISAIGGMLVGTLLGVVVVPTLYILFQTLQEKISGPAKAAASPDNRPI